MKKLKMIGVIGLLFISNLSAAFSSSVNKSLQCRAQDRQAIPQVIKTFLQKDAQKSPVKIKIYYIHCTQDYALTKILYLNPFTNPAYVFLHKNRASWNVVNLDIDFDPQFLKTVPSELRNFYS